MDNYFDKRRRVLEYVLEYARRTGAKYIVRKVCFDNEDVPNFIKEMRRFQRESRRKRILAGCSY